MVGRRQLQYVSSGDQPQVVRGVVAQIGFDSFVDDLSSVDSKGLSHKTCSSAWPVTRASQLGFAESARC